MQPSNKTIRRRLRRYLKLFASQNCQYDLYEGRACLDLFEQLSRVDERCEEINKKLHGKTVAK